MGYGNIQLGNVLADALNMFSNDPKAKIGGVLGTLGTVSGSGEYGASEALAPRVSADTGGNTGFIGPQYSGPVQGPTYSGPAPTSTSDSNFIGPVQTTSGGSTTDFDKNEAKRLATQEAEKKAMEKEIENRYQAALKNLTAQEKLVEAQSGTLKNEIENQYMSQQGLLNSQRAQGLENIGLSVDQAASRKEASEQDAGKRKENALSEAVRLYNELMRGGQQRFGAASSTGEAYGAVVGQELMRNQGGVTQQHEEFIQASVREHEDFLRNVDSVKRNLETEYETSLNSLRSHRDSQLNQATMEYNRAMQAISAAKGGAEDSRSVDKMNLLSELRDKTFTIAMAARQSEENLRAQLMSLQQNLALGEQQHRDALDLLARNNPQTITTQNPISGQTTQGMGMGGQMDLVGLASRRPEDEILAMAGGGGGGSW